MVYDQMRDNVSDNIAAADMAEPTAFSNAGPWDTVAACRVQGRSSRPHRAREVCSLS